MDRQTAPATVWKTVPPAPPRPLADRLAVEEPLEIRVAGKPVSITMRTPGHDRELVAGFLVGEGIVRRPEDITHIRLCDREDGALADVSLAPSAVFDFARLTRHVFASSSCGVCGSATIEALQRSFPPVAAGPSVSAGALLTLPDLLRAAQPAFDLTGGVHGAAIFDANARLLGAFEDVGRHNAVDKAIGARLLAAEWPLASQVLMVSGRASFEIVQKALAASIPIIAAVSAPSSLAANLAERSNITLVGFLRHGGFNIYAHPGRVT